MICVNLNIFLREEESLCAGISILTQPLTSLYWFLLVSSTLNYFYFVKCCQ